MVYVLAFSTNVYTRCIVFVLQTKPIKTKTISSRFHSLQNRNIHSESILKFKRHQGLRQKDPSTGLSRRQGVDGKRLNPSKRTCRENRRSTFVVDTRGQLPWLTNFQLEAISKRILTVNRHGCSQPTLIGSWPLGTNYNQLQLAWTYGDWELYSSGCFA